MVAHLCQRIKLNRRPRFIGFEKSFFPNLTISSYLWQQSFNHNQTQISSLTQGFFYLPDNLRSRYFDLGIELLLKEVFLVKKNATEIYLVTNITPMKYTNRVSRLSYQIDAIVDLRTHTLFTTELLIEDEEIKPESGKSVKFTLHPRSWRNMI